MVYLPVSFRVTSMALGQSYDCPSASEVTLSDMDKINQYQPTTTCELCAHFMVDMPVLYKGYKWYVTYLKVVGRVPVDVVQDEPGGTHQIKTHTTRLGTQQEYNWKKIYCQTSNISHTLAGNKIMIT